MTNVAVSIGSFVDVVGVVVSRSPNADWSALAGVCAFHRRKGVDLRKIPRHAECCQVRLPAARMRQTGQYGQQMRCKGAKTVSLEPEKDQRCVR